MARFGYVVPEFPGQTHSFFWRECTALRREEHEPQLVSTRRPRHQGGHEWAPEAVARTRYIWPLGRGGAAETFREFIRVLAAGRAAGCLRAFRQAVEERAGPRPGLGRASAGVREAALVLSGLRLLSLARAGRWQHVHVHSCADAAQVAQYAYRAGGLPYSVSLHGPLSDYGPNQAAKWADARFALVITEALRQQVRSELGAAVPNDVGLAPMGVDTGHFRRDAPYQPAPAAGPVRLVSCGRLNPSKGHSVLFAAVALLVRDGVDVTLTVLGEDEQGGQGYRHDLEAEVARLGLEDRVALPGALPEGRVREELAKAHLFVLASRAEPLGVAIMEAMAMSLPVVVTRSGGVPELVRDGRDGLLVAPEDPQAVAAAVTRLLADPEAARRLGESGSLRVRTHFDSERGAKAIASRIGQ